MKIKVSNTINTQLDWLVLEAQGCNNGPLLTYEGNGRKWIVTEGGFTIDYATNWAQGGQIIEREKIATKFFESEASWVADVKGGFFEQYGETPLIAAMRCYVASKLGDEVEVPDEICE